VESGKNLELAMGHYQPKYHESLVQMAGQDPGVSSLCWSAWGCWMLGYLELAQKRSREALALAEELDHPFTVTFANFIAGCAFYQMCRDVEATAASSQTVIDLASEHEFPLFHVCGGIISAWAQVVRLTGHAQQAALEQMEAGIETWQEMQAKMQLPHLMGLLAQACGLSGQAQQGLETIRRALEIALEDGELYYQAELYRLQGELLLLDGASDDAAVSFQRAIDAARVQQAKSWELRATTSLARLCLQQGEEPDACGALREVFGWFREGFDMPDLVDAKALLSMSGR
jgi:predicted ATPase